MILVFTLFALGALAQSNKDVAKFFANEIAKKSNGYISKSDEDYMSEEFVLYAVSFPNYYNFDLVRMDIAHLVERFSDVSVVSTWERNSEVNDFNTILVLEENGKDLYLYLIFKPELNILLVSCKRK